MKKLIVIFRNRVVHIFAFFVFGTFFLVLSYEPARSGARSGFGPVLPWSEGMSIDPVFFCIGAALILASWISYKKWIFESISKKE